MNNLEDSCFENTLIEYMPMIRGIVSDYPQHHREDLIQEGILGLCNALRSFKEEEGVPFKQYARVCIKNSVYSGYKKLCKDDFADRINEDLLGDGHEMEEGVISREDTETFFQDLRKNLSGLESKILSQYLSDKSYELIAQTLDVSVKTVDNTLTRIKNKIKKLYK